jgi:hypothetical protein
MKHMRDNGIDYQVHNNGNRHRMRHETKRHNHNKYERVVGFNGYRSGSRGSRSRKKLSHFISDVFYDDGDSEKSEEDQFYQTPTTAMTTVKTLDIYDTYYEKVPWPIKKEAVVEGNVILGGLMMVHEREDNMTCGPIFEQGGIQALEAMLYTLDRINEENLLPNITIGAHILDDCDKDTYGLEIAVDFIKGELIFGPVI